MSSMILIRSVDPAAGTAVVVVYPESCGRCEEDGGHCSRTHRLISVVIPEGLTIRPGMTVQLAGQSGALRRALRRLLLQPLAAAVAGLLLGGARVATMMPAIADQISGRGNTPLGLPLPALLLAVALTALAYFLAWRAGSDSRDWPVIRRIIGAENGVGHPELQLRPVTVTPAAALRQG